MRGQSSSLVPFIDAFVIGDGEEVIREIIEEVRGSRGERPLAVQKQEAKKIY